MTNQEAITAAIVVIGDEILSGRTKDKNIGYIADHLLPLGIDLREIRIVADVQDAIIEAINALRFKYTYVFTTGGIGPTHDDITADAIAKAFDLPLQEDPRAIAMLLEKIRPEELNSARRRMARIPKGGLLIENPISKAPGFMVENVIVMAGVPVIMQAMLQFVTRFLRTGRKVHSQTIFVEKLPEGAYAEDLAKIASQHDRLSIGSYPSFVDGAFRNQIIIRGRDEGEIAVAEKKIKQMIVALQ